MAKRSFMVPTWTTGTGTAENAQLTTLQYQALTATSTTTGCLVSEIYIGGQATSSAVEILAFRRHSTLAATPSALTSPASDGPLNSFTAATAVGTSAFVTSSTQATVSNSITAAKLNLTMNAFGGIVRWVAYPGEEWGIFGTAASLSESSLSGAASNATSTVGSHIIYEGF